MPGPTSLPPAYVFDSDDTAGAVNHGSVLHVVDRDEIRALWTKLGLGASVPAAGQILRGTGAGTSGFGPLEAGDIAAGLITSAMIADGTIVNADVAAAAAIALSKLAAGASGLVKSNGTVISAGNQLAAGDVPSGLITSAMIADGTIATGDIADSQITSAKIADGTIATGDIAANACTQVTTQATGGSTNATPGGYATLNTFNVTASGGVWLMIFNMVMNHTVNNTNGYLGHKIDAGVTIQDAVVALPTVVYDNVVCFVNLGALSAGAHTILAQWATDTGTVNGYSGSAITLIELKK